MIGKVHAGDYILPDGNNIGIGRAVAPADLKNSEIKKVAGIAWTSSEDNQKISTINLAVGLVPVNNQNEIDILVKQGSMITTVFFNQAFVCALAGFSNSYNVFIAASDELVSLP